MIGLLLGVSLVVSLSNAEGVKVVDEQGHAVSDAMVTRTPVALSPLDQSDGGYPKAGLTRRVLTEDTLFTNQRGEVQFYPLQQESKYRVRKAGYEDRFLEALKDRTPVVLKKISRPDQALMQMPANVWLGNLNLGSPDDHAHFKMQCGFCHQQGSFFTRRERTVDDWSVVIKRMVRYGSRLPSDLQKSLPSKLHDEYQRLREGRGFINNETPWPRDLSRVSIREWPVGDGMSQVHDVLTSRNGKVYAADNIQDRLYELDPKTNEITIYKIPHQDQDQPGGLIAGRLRDFPRHDSTSNAHSLAQSPMDGHIFITPSAQRRIIEFNPNDKTFLIHEIGGGFYPHTIRVDAHDRVWFTLALSNQIGMFERKSKTFKLYDLPTRSLKEKFTVRFISVLFKLMNWGVPLSNWLPVDRVASGTPLPYGIDVTPDGKIWFARLHTNEIGVIDPQDDRLKMIATPFRGPRRLRADSNGNLWIVSFGDSALVKYSPATEKFTKYELPVVPLGSETPYSLFVDSKKSQVWVTGNQSDSVFVFNMKTESWSRIPLTKRGSFTRDFDQGADDAIYTSNSHFPSWQIEGAQPTLIEIKMTQ